MNSSKCKKKSIESKSFKSNDKESYDYFHVQKDNLLKNKKINNNYFSIIDNLTFTINDFDSFNKSCNHYLFYLTII